LIFINVFAPKPEILFIIVYNSHTIDSFFIDQKGVSISLQLSDGRLHIYDVPMLKSYESEEQGNIIKPSSDRGLEDNTILTGFKFLNFEEILNQSSSFISSFKPSEAGLLRGVFKENKK
jgi:hypothetical protein